MFSKWKKIFGIPFQYYIWKEIRCLVFLILYTVSMLLFPTFVSLIIDKGISQNNFKMVALYSFCMLFVGISSVVFQYLQQTEFYSLGQELTIAIKQRVYEKILKTDMKFWEKNSVGDILIILQEDVAALENLLTSTISNSIVNVVVMIGISVFIISVDWKSGFFVLVFSFLFAILQKK